MDSSSRSGPAQGGTPAALYQFLIAADGSESLTYINEGVARLFELSPEEALADYRAMEACIAEEHRASHRAALNRAVKSLTLFEHEHRILTRRGNRRWVRNQALPQRQPDGGVLLSGMLSDISERKRLETKLARSETMFRNMFDRVQEGVVVLSPSSEWLEVNDRFCEMLGYTRAELSAMSWLALTHPDDREQSIASYKSAMRGETDQYVDDKRYLCKNGDVLSARMEFYVERKADGSVDYFMATVRERGERRSPARDAPGGAGDFLIAEFHAEFFRETSLGVAYHRLIWEDGEPADYVYLYTNPAFHEHTRMQGSVIGKRVSEVRPGIRRSDPQIFETFARVSSGGAPERMETYVSALGGWYSIWIYSPRRDHFFSIFEDISGRKRQEADLGRAQELLALAQRASRSGVFSLDVATGEAVWSEEYFQLLGLDPATAKASVATWENAIHPEDREAARLALREAMYGGKPVEYEYRIARPTGEVLWLARYGATSRDDSGRPLRVSGIAIDITARKREEFRRADVEGDLRRALDEIEARERSKSRFLAATTHDLRQPLFAAQLQLDRLAEGTLSGRDLQAVDRARSALTAMSGALKQLLDRSVREESEPELRFRDIVAADVFEGLADIFGATAERSRVRLLFRAGAHKLRSDPNMLTRLLGNLIDNAVKFSPGGTVLVCARWSAGGVLLQVRDNGAGIADFDGDRTFGNAFTLGHGERDAQGGYGLGLWIVGRMARLLGCDLAAASAPGRGSCFTLRVPG